MSTKFHVITFNERNVIGKFKNNFPKILEKFLNTERF